MSIPKEILNAKRDALLTHCSKKYGVDHVMVDSKFKQYMLTSGTTEINLVLTNGGMHVNVRSLGTRELQGLKHGLLRDYSLLTPAISVNMKGRNVKDVWLTRDSTIPDMFHLSASRIRDIPKVEAVVIAMLRFASYD